MKTKKIRRRIAFFLLPVLILTTVFISPAPALAKVAALKLSGTAHVQSIGDAKGSFDGTTLTLGTTGRGLRMEQISVSLSNQTTYKGGIEYRVHRQTYGWTDFVKGGRPAGTTGEGKRLEAIEIRLTGALAKQYSVRYRVHIQTYGWSQGWRYDGATAGTTGEGKRLECLEIQLVKKSDTMHVLYGSHRQTYGWETDLRSDGMTSGTVGEGKRLESIRIRLSGSKYKGSISYRTHVQTYGWLSWVKNGAESGTQGEGKRLEAIEIRLSGEIAKHYDICYRVHAQTYGWLSWAKNGETAGTAGRSKRLEAIEIQLVKKGEALPDTGRYPAYIDASMDDLFQNALLPVGSTMYIWGGGWNEADTGAGVEAVTIGLSPRWKEFADAQDASYDHKKYAYHIHDGLDCTGYIGWVVYNTLNKKSGYEGCVAKNVTETFVSRGWGNMVNTNAPKPGDICETSTHVWMSLGTCADGSILLVHASPPGVSICGTLLPNGTKSQAVALAEKLMSTYYPAWYKRFPNCTRSYSYITSATVFRWNNGTLTDEHGLRDMSAEQLADYLFR